MGRLNDVSKDVRQGVMSGLRDVFIVWRRQGYPYVMEKKFTDLVRVLSRDDDLPSKTFADGIESLKKKHFRLFPLIHDFLCYIGILQSMLDVNLDQMNISTEKLLEIVQ